MSALAPREKNYKDKKQVATTSCKSEHKKESKERKQGEQKLRRVLCGDKIKGKHQKKVIS
jgi:hypothetical protein